MISTLGELVSAAMKGAAMRDTLRGFYAIGLTPFDAQGDLLWEDLEREFDWIVRAGAHGLLWPVNDSEQTVLSFPERRRGIRLMTATVDGRIPVVAGVADTSKAGAVALAETAGDAGADAVIALPPWATKMNSNVLIKDYYRAIADAAGVPVFVQNLLPPVGSGLSSEFILELCREIPLVQYAKEERDPHGENVSELIDLAGPELEGVFTGGHLLGLVNAHKRGAAGNIASCELADVYAQIWDLMEEGREAEAQRLQDLEAAFYKRTHAIPRQGSRKHVLVRRGVFTSDALRNLGSPVLDDVFMAELEHVLGLLEPYFRV
jgi:4-hydroxy-tetrahydrodipicolinate synthase